MSLKHFHLVFIAATLGLMGFLAYWSLTLTRQGLPQPLAGACAAVGLAAGLAYLNWFLRKYRALA